MWAYEGTLAGRDVVLRESKTPHCTTPAHPVLVLDWSEAGQAALRDLIAKTVFGTSFTRIDKMPPHIREAMFIPANRVIEALASAKRKGRGK